MPMSLGSYASRSVATAVVATDGTGDFTDIQAALDSLPAAGGVIYIKEGTYTISVAITLFKHNVSIIGAGKSTILDGINPASDLFFTNSRHNIVIKDMTIQNSENVTDGINTTDSDNCKIINCWINGFENNIEMVRSEDTVITNCTVFNATHYGIIGRSGTRTKITNCRIYDNAYDGIELGNEARVIIANNIIYSNDYGGVVVGDMTNSIGNIIFQNKRYGIWLHDESRYNIISNNVIYDNDFLNTASYDGILLDLGDENIISGNRCRDNDRYEINISAAGCNDNFIHGNHCKGTDHVGAINDAGTNTTSADNVII